MSNSLRAPVAQQLWAMLRLRCPVCLQGQLFRSLLGMHHNCPVCGVAFEREHGYYLNSMFIAYALGFLVIVPSAVLLALRNVSVGLFSVAIILETIIVWPLIFRYARSLWLHMDQMLDPRTPHTLRAERTEPQQLYAETAEESETAGDGEA